MECRITREIRREIMRGHEAGTLADEIVPDLTVSFANVIACSLWGKD